MASEGMRQSVCAPKSLLDAPAAERDSELYQEQTGVENHWNKNEGQ
jgi:hypothetical protein